MSAQTPVQDAPVDDVSVKGSTIAAGNEDEKAGETAGDEGQPVRHVSRFTRVYRSPLFNVILVGLISFTQPGIWNALNSESTSS
jgi:hypothetical protein